MKIGKNMKALVKFAEKYPGPHHYQVNHKPTRDAVKRLEKLGLVKVNQFDQFERA